jgi:hypothetical protein
MVARVAGAVFLAAVAVDLATKEWAVHYDDGLIHHEGPARLPLRVAASLAAIAAAAVVAGVARRVGLGRQWGLVVGCSLLVGGTIANGVSALVWTAGVPDFIDMPRGWVFNVADFEIVIGLVGGLLSVIATAFLAYLRERASPPPGDGGDASPQLSPR